MNHGEKIRTTCVRVHYSTWATHQEVLFAEMLALNLHIMVYRAFILVSCDTLYIVYLLVLRIDATRLHLLGFSSRFLPIPTL